MTDQRGILPKIWRKIAHFLIIFFILALVSCIHKQVPPAPTPVPPKPAKIAVVLGAGASKGFAHIGVLKELENHKIPIHMIVGTSAGSVVGCFYAYGYDAFRLQKMAMAIEKDDVIDWTIPNNGFIKGERLEQYINKSLHNTPIENLKIRFYAVATDFAAGEEVVFAAGNTGKAVRASCSIPGVFQPVKISGKTYVDGGVVSPVAIDVARRYGADVIIAVDISSGRDGTVPDGTIETILVSINIMYSKIAACQLPKADVVIRPKVGYIGSSDMTKRHEAILEGEKAAIEAMPAIQEIITRLRQEGRLQP